MIIGAHVSTAGGLVKACEKAHRMGANGMQIFTGSPRIWKGKTVESYEVTGLGEAVKKYRIGYLVIHATYLVNLASDKPELVSKSVDCLVNDMQIAGKLAEEMRVDNVGVVVHLGSHQGRGYAAMQEQMVEKIKMILDKSPENARFLIENSAGQNGKVGSDLEEVEDLIEAVGDPRLGWCLDTCHAYAAGYVLGRNQKSNLKNPTHAKASAGRQNDKSKSKKSQQSGLFDIDEEAEPERLLVDEIDRLKLWKRLWCMHVNDSRDPFDSGRDRHENIGDGLIPKEVLGEFLRDKRVREVPLILEVPGIDGKGPDKENVERLKKLVE